MTTFPFSSTPARSARLIVVALALMLAVAAFAATSAHAASIVVNDAGDTTGTCSTTGTGTCTLRDAITFANSNAGADTITFNIPSGGACSSANTCTITLGSLLPSITTAMTIDGEPNNGHITVSGNNAYSVFDVRSGTTINALTIADAAFGGIDNLSTVNVTNSTFTNNNHVGASGGAIINVGQLTVVNSTFYNNSATNGGAIDSGGGTVTVINSTFSGNSATFLGGAVRGNGGSMTLRNNIFTNSTNGGNCAGTFTADSYNIADDNTCDSATQKTSAEIALSALASNGGPTQTMAIDNTSAAFNTGDNAVCAAAPVNGLDQRGVTRPQGPQCDVGAYEAAVSCPAFPVNVANEAELNTAIGCYNAETVAGSYTISVTQNISLTASTTAIDNATSGVELVIEGNGHTVDGQNTSGVRPFAIEDDTTVTLKNMTITRGNTQDGAGISNSGTLTILNSTVSYNQATRFGGGIDNGGTLYLVNSTVSNNVASNQTNAGSGGGIYNDPSSTLTVVNSTISDNTAWVFAGGIQNATGSTLTLHNSIVANNTSDSSPSSPDCTAFNATATAQNSLVETGTIGQGCLIGSNNLTGDPNLGPLQNNGGPTETHALLPASIAINAGANALAVDPGGSPLPTDQRGPGFPRINGGTVDMGAYEFGCPVFPVGVATEGQLNYAIACYNAETVAGSYTIIIAADIDLTASTTAIDNATSGVELVIEGNGHAVDGQNTSGVRPFNINDDTTVTLKNMTITRGNSQDGAGISNSGTLTILNSTISYNQATRYGGGIDNGGTLYLVNSTVSHNVASNQTNEGSGGGIYNDPSSTLTVVNSTISDNTAWVFAGGIQNATFSTLTLHNSIVANNTSNSSPSSPDCTAFNATATAQNSLVETGSIGNGCLQNGANNLTGDPNLGPLQNNGGPTETHALLPGSIAINAGANALAVDPGGIPLPTDQRGAGFPRVFGGTVDMGAYELQANGTIIITKQTAPANQGEFDFTHNITATATFTLTGGQSETFLNVAPGTYTVTEAIEPLWRLVDLRCDDVASSQPSSGDVGTRTATIELEPGETVTCTFTNSQDDIIIVQKRTLPAGGTGFDFTVGGAGSGSFTLDDGQLEVLDVISGTYTITETDPSPAYLIADIACTIFGPGPDDELAVDGDPDTGSVDLTLTTGQAAYCLFTNVEPGSITIVKDADPEDNTPFTFDVVSINPLSPTQFILQDPLDNTRTYTDVLPASYFVTEQAVAGWSLGDIACQSTTGASVFQNTLSEGRVFINLAAGDDVTCTFVNAKNGSITIVKDADPEDNTPFTFDVVSINPLSPTQFILQDPLDNTRTYTDVLPASYFVTEQAVAGWSLGDIACQSTTGASVFQNTLSEGRVFINLAAGDDVTCTFVNRQPSIVMSKTVGADPNVCATTDNITVPSGTDVYYCYTVTNTGDVALPLHDLVDSELGTLLDDFAFNLAPGATVSTVDAGAVISITATSSVTNTAVWTAFVDPSVTASFTDTATVMVMPPTAVTLSGLAASSPTPLAGPWWLVAVMAAALAAAAAVVWRRRQMI